MWHLQSHSFIFPDDGTAAYLEGAVNLSGNGSIAPEALTNPRFGVNLFL